MSLADDLRLASEISRACSLTRPLSVGESRPIGSDFVLFRDEDGYRWKDSAFRSVTAYSTVRGCLKDLWRYIQDAAEAASW